MVMERAREPSTPGRAPTCKLSAGRVHAMTSVMTELRAQRTNEKKEYLGKILTGSTSYRYMYM